MTSASEIALDHVRNGRVAVALDVATQTALFGEPAFHRDLTYALLKHACEEAMLQAALDAGLQMDRGTVDDHLRLIIIRSLTSAPIFRVPTDATLRLLLKHGHPGDRARGGGNLLALALAAPLNHENARLLEHVERHCNNEARWNDPAALVADVGSHKWRAARLFVQDTEISLAELPALVHKHIYAARVDTIVYVASRLHAAGLGLEWLHEWARAATPPGNWAGLLCHYPYPEHSPVAVAWNEEAGRVLRSLQEQAAGNEDSSLA